MQLPETVTEEEALVAELELLDIRYLTRQTTFRAPQVRPPAQLLADLVRQPSARVRESVIAILLAHPGFSSSVPEALTRLDKTDGTVLRLFYSAAVLLQRGYALEIKSAMEDEWRKLPDLFCAELGIEASHGSLPDQLDALGRAHQTLTGISANWAGTYENVAHKLLRRWSKERQWSQNK